MARKEIVYLFIIDKLIAHMCILYDLVLNICINYNPKNIARSPLQFWDEMWKTTLSVHQIFEYFPPDDVRKLIRDRPGNLKTLFTQAVAQLFQVVETPYPVYFDQALNCTRCGD